MGLVKATMPTQFFTSRDTYTKLHHLLLFLTRSLPMLPFLRGLAMKSSFPPLSFIHRVMQQSFLYSAFVYCLKPSILFCFANTMEFLKQRLMRMGGKVRQGRKQFAKFQPTAKFHTDSSRGSSQFGTGRTCKKD